MGIGVSIFFLAVGAILTFAVEAQVAGLDIATVGVILMAVGGLGLIVSMFFAESLFHRGDDRVVERHYDRV